MPDYSLSKIYQIVNTQNDLIYVGSTSQKLLSTRFGGHKRDSLRYDIPFYNDMKTFGCEQFRILLIKVFPCKSKQELEAEEYATMQQFIKDGKTLYNLRLSKNGITEKQEQILKKRNMGNKYSLGLKRTDEQKKILRDLKFDFGCINRRIKIRKSGLSHSAWCFQWWDPIKQTRYSKSFAIKTNCEYQAFLKAQEYRKNIYPEWKTDEEICLDEFANISVL